MQYYLKTKIMNGLKFSQKHTIAFYFVVLAISCISCSKSPDIVVQNLQMEMPQGMQVFTEELMKGEIAETKIEHIAYVGPTEQSINLLDSNVNLFIFINGNGTLYADSITRQLSPESIAIPFNEIKQVRFEVPEGEVLHFLQFTKKLSTQDIEDLNNFPEENKYKLFFTRFDDCVPYTEKIKSPNTTSRTVLPGGVVPRVALGTVEAPGPDEVGAHKHPMLDQLFLGLTDNNIVVHADGASAQFKEYALLHIPLGASHWASVAENKKMYYLWMDFFTTKEGQEWLKTHKPVSTDKNDY
jgi:quercetin dioxygenase-like cupin family protein